MAVLKGLTGESMGAQSSSSASVAGTRQSVSTELSLEKLDVAGDADMQAALQLGLQQSPVVDGLFRKMDEAMLTRALDLLMPSVSRTDMRAKYLAMCVNLQIAAMTIGYVLLVRVNLLTPCMV